MLPQSWEPVAEELAQCPDDQVAGIIMRILNEHANEAVSASDNGAPRSTSEAVVLVGYDTRPSAPELLRAAKAGIAAMGLEVHDAGESDHRVGDGWMDRLYGP